MEHRELSQLKINPRNPRGEVVVDEALRELAASIEAQGVLQPILITPDGTIVAGHRRVKAAELAALRTIPVIVRELSELQQLQVMLIENLQREDLNTLQTAKTYQLLTEHGLSIREISKATGFSASSISKHIDILSLPAELHHCFDGEFSIPLGGVKYLLELKSDEQLRIGKLAAEKRWLISEIVGAVGQAKGDRFPSVRQPATTQSNNREDAIARAIVSLYAITDKLEEQNAPRPAMFKLADGIRELEREVKKRNAA